MQISTALALREQLNTDSPKEDVEYLLMAVLEVDRSYLYTWPERQLNTEQSQQFQSFFKARQQGKPIAYILGQRGFWQFELAVNPQTLIPRADTEVLVEWALKLELPQQVSALDLGTGSGAIALSLAFEKPHWQVFATDRIEAAAQLAQHNANRLNLNNVEILVGDWFQPLSGRFDLIVSNPPYISLNDEHLNNADLRFEPQSALVADADGLADLKQIIEQASTYLNEGGWLIVEHGFEQGVAVRSLFKHTGYSLIETREDYGANPRATAGCWRSKC